MRIPSRLKKIVAANAAAVLMAVCFSASAYAASVVSYTEGCVVFNEKDGSVAVDTPVGLLFPSNSHGLFRSGQIKPGEWVDVKIVQNTKRGKHRGHVTVLK